MASRFWSSICTGSDGSAAGEVASSFMIESALTAGAPNVTFDRVRVEDRAAGAPHHRVEPDGRSFVLGALDLDVVRLSLLRKLLCVSDHLAHVVGGDFTRSERYHSSWVLLLSGTA